MSEGSCGQKKQALWALLCVGLAIPLMGLAYVASVPGNIVAFHIELMLAGQGSVEALNVPAKTSAHKPLPAQAAALFYLPGRGPRADKYHFVRGTLGYNNSQRPITASLVTGALSDEVSGAISQPPRRDNIEDAVERFDKGNLLTRRVSDNASANLPGATTGNMPGTPSRFDAWSFAQFADPGPMQWATFKPLKTDAVSYKGETEAEFEQRQRRCLATAIYFEARGEPVRGQLAVAQVVMNRMRSPNFPDTVCGVVFQGQLSRHCQFSFACDGHSDQPRQGPQWELAQELARQVTSDEVWLPEVSYSTYYHANYVRPRWVREMRRLDVIGNHIFYKRRHEAPYIVPGDHNKNPNSNVLSVADDNAMPDGAATPLASNGDPTRVTHLDLRGSE